MQAFIFLVLCLGWTNCNREFQRFSYSTSVVAMTNVLDTERVLIDILDDRLWKIQIYNDTLCRSSKYKSLQRFLNDLRKEHKKSKKDKEKYLSNPLKSFSLMRRIFVDWRTILNYLNLLITKNNLRFLDLGEISAAYVKQFPSSFDLMEATEGMERIRKSYNLSPIDMAEGLLNGVKYDARLSSTELFTIGFELFKLEKFADALLWVNASLNTNYTGLHPKEISDFNRQDARQLYTDTLYQSNHAPKEIRYTNDELIDLDMICRGEQLRLSKEFCRYNKTVNSFYFLAPMKMEELSIDPYVVIFHDVLTNDEIDDIKYMARFSLKPAEILMTNENTKSSDYRSSHTSVIVLNTSVMRKVLAITGFDSTGFEPVTALNYGLGGHYSIHTDFFSPKDVEKMEYGGNRIATILLYLNEVEQGGETVFPYIGLAVKPQKGSLLLWYNMKNSGKVDWNTCHGSCPIIFGSKWAYFHSDAVVVTPKFLTYISLDCDYFITSYGSQEKWKKTPDA